MAFNEKQNYLTAGKYFDEADPYSLSASPLSPATPRRLSNESSPASSDYGTEIKEVMATASTKSFDLYHTKSHFNIRVHDMSGNCVYYVDNSSFRPGIPDVTLSAGSEKGGQVLGVCRWSTMFSKGLMVGIGDPSVNEKGVTWEEVRSEHAMHPEYRWSVTLPSGARHAFAWLRIHGADVRAESADANGLSNKNFKLVDCSDPNKEALAVFANNRWKSWKKLGKFMLKVDGRERGWGDQWEVMALLSVLGLLEMSRRRGRQRRSQGGNYGG